MTASWSFSAEFLLASCKHHPSPSVWRTAGTIGDRANRVRASRLESETHLGEGNDCTLSSVISAWQVVLLLIETICWTPALSTLVNRWRDSHMEEVYLGPHQRQLKGDMLVSCAVWWVCSRCPLGSRSGRFHWHRLLARTLQNALLGMGSGCWDSLASVCRLRGLTVSCPSPLWHFGKEAFLSFLLKFA